MLTPRHPAPADHAIHDLLLERRSGRAFDERDIEPDVLLRVFEAARWSPSSANEQPWRFVIARRRDSASFARLLGALVPTNQTWARRAAVLGISAAAQTSQRTGAVNRWAWYDTGQAMAHLSIQATHEGLMVHQMAGYDAARARDAAGIPEGFEPVTAFAIGYPGDPAVLEGTNQKRETAPRVRRPLAEIVYEGLWGTRFKSGR
jgi:nitroreductase